MAARVAFLSPIPPQKTGTADYFSVFLRQAFPALKDRELLIVIDGAQYPAPLPTAFQDIPVIDYRQFQPSQDMTAVVFLANNPFHRYVLSFLNQKPICPTISILHDPQIFMLAEGSCVKSMDDFTPAQLAGIVDTQFPKLASEFARAAPEGAINEIVHYVTSAQGPALRNSKAILVHSHYAALKLTLETITDLRLPPIHVIEHPHDDYPDITPIESPTEFRIGVFGWVNAAKRPKAIVQAFAQLLKELSPQQADRTQLRFVGALEDKRLDPRRHAAKLGVEGRVSVAGYVPLDSFKQELTQCSLILNLRYPSCGETSGTLQRARDLRIPVAVSAYQAFFEEPADFHISIDPKQETQDILNALRTAYKTWVAHGTTQSLIKTSDWRSRLKKANAVDILHQVLTNISL